MGTFKNEFNPTMDSSDCSLASISEEGSMASTTIGETSSSDGEQRDERKEVYKMSAKDTRRVQLWRVAVTVVLLLTAVAVTLTTYRFLKEEETSNFEVAFEQFSRTLAEAALEEQKSIRDAMKTLADTISGQAMASNQTWPNVMIELQEVYSANALTQSMVEFVSLVPRVYDADVRKYIGFMNRNSRKMNENAHMIRYGDLSRMLNDSATRYTPFISTAGPQGFGPDGNKTEYWPGQTYSPPSPSDGMNFNVGSLRSVAPAVEAMKTLQYETVFTPVETAGGRTSDMILGKELHASFHSQFEGGASDTPHGFVLHPVHVDPTDPYSEIVAMLTAGMAFDASLRDLLPQGVEGIYCIIVSQYQNFTYEVVGGDAYYLGEEDQHQTKYDDYRVEIDLALHTNPEFKTTPGHSQYEMVIYPSDRFRATYDSNTPEVFAIAVAITFGLVAIVFFVYDLFVSKRNENLVAKAAQSNAIVTSLFPEHMRERLMQEKEEDQQAQDQAHKNRRKSLGKSLKDGTFTNVAGQMMEQKPMADLYLETTVMFADITGFTAWSSVREPSQVFVLLETIFHAFDAVARRRKVFKVETVGDCYVAVAGLPDPRPDHALMIARFARDILVRFRRLTHQLEVQLGPDTGALDLRIGVHSGQVTAGVLRGDRARFQLFGDTMNICQRVESTGTGGMVHCSRETAACLRNLGREAWLEKRSDLVEAKGVGLMETYWLKVPGERAGSVQSMTPSIASKDSNDVQIPRRQTHTSMVKAVNGLDAKVNRLIKWNCEMLIELLQQIVARRDAKELSRSATRRSKSIKNLPSSSTLQQQGNPLDEVKEIISLPEFDATAASRQQDPSQIQIPQEVVDQLHMLVTEISRLYNNNPFHNFDHASHVVMSVIKLMSRIKAPSHLDDSDKDHNLASTLHDHTYGITSDPLTQFACAFSALIHDADHVGVSNAQLVKEETPVAKKYQNRSVAEQNSLDLSWNLLMEPRFETFRSFLFSSPSDMQRFRALVVNSVMSTDIVDKEMKNLRNGRWEKAFKKQGGDAAGAAETAPVPNTSSPETAKEAIDRKATIVIEHIIQASDISHTMQHWHVYCKWNQNLFEELYVAYLNGRMEKDPAEFWYKGEFGFFDFYIIPLTRKLKECGVFGVSSDEFLNYATKNREMWELKGEERVAEMITEVRQKYGVKEPEQPEEESEHPVFQDEITKEIDV